MEIAQSDKVSPNLPLDNKNSSQKEGNSNSNTRTKLFQLTRNKRHFVPGTALDLNAPNKAVG